MTLADTTAPAPAPTAAATPGTGTGTVLDVVVRALAAHSGARPASIDTAKPLAAIPGIESVKALRAITEIEDELGIAIPDDFLFETATVGDLAAFVAGLVQEDTA
ncbi:acyl carrier protein [Streptomyces sp. NRRL S-87]|uniref:acyl carrier protein n=1 Tax=Streptomyces sp. NRRL S-87 TaxID=1463920 RepID=UPI00068D0F08|nr:acyl carrier protein [Streptomyces sp. NRRL S-87]